MAFSFKYSEEKNQLLKASRGISFEDVLTAIKADKLLDTISHPNKQRVHQKMYILTINEYVYVVPHVINTEKKEIFLKTIYPSRFFTRKYLSRRKAKHEKPTAV